MRLEGIVRAFGLVAFAGVVPQGIAAQKPAAVGPTSFSFDLDTPGGHFTDWAITEFGSVTHVDAQLTINELREHPDWRPVFSVILGDSTEAVAIQIAAPERNLPLVLQIVHLVKNAAVEGYRAEVTPEIGVPLRLAIDFANPEQLVIVFNGTESYEVAVQKPLRRLVFAAASGQMKSDLVQTCRADTRLASC